MMMISARYCHAVKHKQQQLKIYNYWAQKYCWQTNCTYFYDQEIDEDITWNGKITKYRPVPPVYTINYWTATEHETDAQPSNMNVFSLAADFVCQDLLFI